MSCFVLIFVFLDNVKHISSGFFRKNLLLNVEYKTNLQKKGCDNAPDLVFCQNISHIMGLYKVQ
jgi:hypothetical protein